MSVVCNLNKQPDINKFMIINDSATDNIMYVNIRQNRKYQSDSRLRSKFYISSSDPRDFGVSYYICYNKDG